MIIEERYGNRVNAEEFAVEIKRGHLYCSPERSNLLYLIGRSTYVNRRGQVCHTSEILRREPFSKDMMEEMLDQKDRLKEEQTEIDIKAAQLAGSMNRKLIRRIKIEKGWAIREEDEEDAE